MQDGWIERLAAHRPAEESPASGPQAAVAALLRRGEPGWELLLMQRVTCEGDRWSGQVSLPGGRAEPGDADLRATAERETLEEVHIDLGQGARRVGRLARFGAVARGRRVELEITPFVYAAEQELEARPGPEAEAVFWLPLERAMRGELDDTYRHEQGGLVLKLPCWRFEGRVVWGMTHRVVTELIALGSG